MPELTIPQPDSSSAERTPRSTSPVRLALPKGRMHEEVVRLLDEAGVRLGLSARGYRPSISLERFEVKVLKPRAIVEMLAVGARDVGFAGADWIRESEADVVELLDTGLNPVRLVAAAPEELLEQGELPARPVRVATEYIGLAKRWIADRGLEASVLRSHGATEVLPPEDADLVIDNTATGATLAANGLRIIDELMTSSTCLCASRQAWADPAKRERIERFTTLVQGVLEARRRVMLELNVPEASLETVIAALPCMREPTVARLSSGGGYAVKAAIRREQLPEVIAQVKALGGTDLIVTRPEQIVI